MSEATRQSAAATAATETGAGAPAIALAGKSVVVYDGVCGLCNRFVAFVLRRDRAAQFLFAPLQGEFARAALARHGMDGAAMDTVALVLNPGADGERVLVRSEAVAEVLARLGAIWKAAALGLRLVPRGFRDAVYRQIALHRYRFFGRSERCALPPADMSARFLP